MTNGDIIKAILKPRTDQIRIYSDWVEIEIQSLAINFSCELSWWNAEYKEPTTENNLGVDCIDRNSIKYYQGTGGYMYASKGEIDKLPPVTPQEPRWIPVKDRLPQKGEYGDVLVTLVPPAGTLWATVMIARYSDLMGIAKPCFHIGEVGKESFENITPQVTAWMPLPQAYREVKK